MARDTVKHIARSRGPRFCLQRLTRVHFGRQRPPQALVESRGVAKPEQPRTAAAFPSKRLGPSHRADLDMDPVVLATGRPALLTADILPRSSFCMMG